MFPLGDRILQLYYRDPKDSEALSRSVDALRDALFSAIQDVAVMKAMLEAKGLWDDRQYKDLRIDRMLKDCSSAGSSPERSYSYYPYFLSHEDFLRHQWNASDEEVDEFVRKRRAMLSMT